MSEQSAVITEQHIRYIASHARGDDTFLTELKAAARAAGLPAIWIAPEQASVVQILLRASGARVVLDVGTLAGYSAIRFARALPEDGHVHTFEINEAHADFAEAWIAKSDVAGKITVHRGPAADSLAPFSQHSADVMFLDADKAGYPTYFEIGLRVVRPGGLILADNAFAFGQLFDETPTDSGVADVRAFNELIAMDPRVEAAILPLGDGCWISVVL